VRLGCSMVGGSANTWRATVTAARQKPCQQAERLACPAMPAEEPPGCPQACPTARRGGYRAARTPWAARTACRPHAAPAPSADTAAPGEGGPAGACGLPPVVRRLRCQLTRPPPARAAWAARTACRPRAAPAPSADAPQRGRPGWRAACRPRAALGLSADAATPARAARAARAACCLCAAPAPSADVAAPGERGSGGARGLPPACSAGAVGRRPCRAAGGRAPCRTEALGSTRSRDLHVRGRACLRRVWPDAASAGAARAIPRLSQIVSVEVCLLHQPA